MRERLIELIRSADKAGVEYADKLNYTLEPEEAYAFIADYLLENGVVVLPEYERLIKSEARREFANRLQLTGMEDGAYVLLKLEQIQKLLEEMDGEQ